MDDPSAARTRDPRLSGIGVGQRLGRYRLSVEIASGGMATVFLALAEGAGGFEKPVAIKVIHPHLAKERQFVEMFLDEARIASRISHRNVCPVFDFGEADGIYYIAMEYLVGEPLSRVLRAVSATDPEHRSPHLRGIFCHLVADACEGLHAAHELRDAQRELLRVVHRDVSPQNVFVSYDGSARIVDFGIASAADRVHQTVTGTVKGKYGYMSPEQIRGRRVDRRADVWSLGVVAWECLTLRRLFARDSQTETVLAVVEEPIPPPSQVNPDVSPELDAVVLGALARDRDARYATAREMGRDLLRAVASTGSSVTLPDVAEWMEVLFPGGAGRRQALVESVETGVAQPTSLNETPSSEELESLPIYEAAERTHIKRSAGAGPPPTAEVPTLPRRVPAEEGRRRPRPAAIAALMILLLAVGAGSTWAVIESNRSSQDGEMGSEATLDDPPAADDVVESSPAPQELPAGEETSTPAPPPSEPSAPEASTPGETETPSAPEVGDEAPPEPVARPVAEEEPAERAPREARSRRARTRARTAPAEAGRGSVDVVTPGSWAEVWWRGQRLRQTPCRVELPAGRQVLELRPLGQTPGRRVPVNVRADAVTRVRVPLDP